MNDIKLEKLDGRHALVTVFTHRAKLAGMDNVTKFIEIRNWLWEHYGFGVEREIVWIVKYHDDAIKPKWAWHVEDRKYYLYMKEEVLTHFTLKWMNT
jgi:hypothetical protein